MLFICFSIRTIVRPILTRRVPAIHPIFCTGHPIQPPRIDGKIVPIHDPYKNKYLRRSGKRLVGKDHRYKAIRLE